MPVYIITGRLGSGKSLIGVRRAQEYLQKGLPVATNMDLNLEYLMPHDDKSSRVIRLPDQPTAEAINSLGSAYEGEYDEKKFGLMLFDELGSWLNSRSWNNKDRQPFIETCIHLRKRYWDVAFLVQDISMIDAQVRNALCEFLVTCKRTDRLKIPGTNYNAPKAHVASVYYGDTPSKALKEDTWVYRGKALYKAYDTTQSFSPFYDKGPHSLLPPGYFMPQIKPENKGNTMGIKTVLTCTLLCIILGWVGWSVYRLSTGAGGLIANSTAAELPTAETVEAEDKITQTTQEFTEVANAAPPLHEYTYKGYLKTAEHRVFFFESPEETALAMPEPLVQAVGYEVISADVDRLVMNYEGQSVIFGWQ